MKIHHPRGRLVPLLCMVLAALMLPGSVALANHQWTTARAGIDHGLTTAAREQAEALSNYFERSRSIMLLTSHNPAFSDFYSIPGSRVDKIEAGGPVVDRATDALGFLQTLFPESIGEVCFIDRAGPENARVVRGERASVADLSPDESTNPFFGPTFSVPGGIVYQARPYVSPDTHEWVISNSAVVPTPGGTSKAIVHFEVTIESFRRAAFRFDGRNIRVVDARTGAVVIDSAHPQAIGAPLGRPDDRRFAKVARSGRKSGLVDVDGLRTSFEIVPREPGNENEWVVLATQAAPSLIGPVGGLPPAIFLLGLGLLIGSAGVIRRRQRELKNAAAVDPLTGLGNRRALMAELRRRVALSKEEPFLVVLFDLNGFKPYNDSFGHAAGDALLTLLGHRLRDAAARWGGGYRLGGDEFCVLASTKHAPVETIIASCSAALSENGEGFSISAAYGCVFVPEETADAAEALGLADSRMYEQKNAGRVPAGRQTADVLLQALQERYPDLYEHVSRVAAYSETLGRRLGLLGEEITSIHLAAQLHDVGKVSVPDYVLTKSGPLTDNEWEIMRRHPLAGERILNAAPSLGEVARIVRAHHERFDGSGYPSRLRGEQIPLGARIVAVCDAYHAMISDRPYRKAIGHALAIEELRRNAGTQFDPAIVEAFIALLSEAGATAASVESASLDG